MPIKTVAQDVVSNKLLSTSAPSRETGAKIPPCFKIGARHANSAKALAMKKLKMMRMAMPRCGSLAKACTELNTPERTRKVPSSEKEKAKIARKMVQIFNEPFFSITATEWTKADPASHGMSEAFSTGSQNQKPPQPSV